MIGVWQRRRPRMGMLVGLLGDFPAAVRNPTSAG